MFGSKIFETDELNFRGQNSWISDGTASQQSEHLAMELPSERLKRILPVDGSVDWYGGLIFCLVRGLISCEPNHPDHREVSACFGMTKGEVSAFRRRHDHYLRSLPFPDWSCLKDRNTFAYELTIRFLFDHIANVYAVSIVILQLVDPHNRLRYHRQCFNVWSRKVISLREAAGSVHLTSKRDGRISIRESAYIAEQAAEISLGRKPFRPFSEVMAEFESAKAHKE